MKKSSIEKFVDEKKMQITVIGGPNVAITKRGSTVCVKLSNVLTLSVCR